jgi:hypothetical protein
MSAWSVAGATREHVFFVQYSTRDMEKAKQRSLCSLSRKKEVEREEKGKKLKGRYV